MTTDTMTYRELLHRQEQEMRALPTGYAFTDGQFDAMMRGWGLDPDADKDKIRPIGCGGYIRNEDAERFHAMRARHRAEMDAAVAADGTGDGFIHGMFRYELGRFDRDFALDHLDDVLRGLGYTAGDVADDPRLLHGLQRAAAELRAA